MNTLEWRGKARVVAYVELFLSCMALFGVIQLVAFACAFSDVAINREMIIDKIKPSQSQTHDVGFKIDPFSTSYNTWDSRRREYQNTIDKIKHTQAQYEDFVKDILARSTWILWIIAVVLAIITFFQMWAAVSLLKATDVGSQDREALGKAAIWRNITVALLLFDLMTVYGRLVIGFYMSGIFGIVCIVVWGIFLYVVQKFISELQSRLTMTSFPDPTVVTMKN